MKLDTALKTLFLKSKKQKNYKKVKLWFACKPSKITINKFKTCSKRILLYKKQASFLQKNV